ncbi:hypothetical protein [Streptomyces sp. NPDC052107]|uniref:hypothetical protein n=1 Tax=Streptomyces sp. NPDC052107 TaxID=3155632 RepID=UPI003444E33D
MPVVHVLVLVPTPTARWHSAARVIRRLGFGRPWTTHPGRPGDGPHGAEALRSAVGDTPGRPWPQHRPRREEGAEGAEQAVTSYGCCACDP